MSIDRVLSEEEAQARRLAWLEKVEQWDEEERQRAERERQWLLDQEEKRRKWLQNLPWIKLHRGRDLYGYSGYKIALYWSPNREAKMGESLYRHEASVTFYRPFRVSVRL